MILVVMTILLFMINLIILKFFRLWIFLF